MKRRIPVVFLALLGLLACSASLRAAPPKGKPNVLFFAVDDMRPELNCYGKTYIKSPNIDKLAGRGVQFNRAYCQQAVCSPTRTSLLTGLRPDSTRVYDLVTHFRDTVPDVVTLPQHFKNNGYHTVGFSKIFHDGLDDPVSWSEPHRGPKAGTYQLPENQQIVARKTAEARKKGLQGKALSKVARGPAFECADVPDNAYNDGKTTEMAIAKLDELARQDKPFFLAVGYYKPHLPFVSPKRYWDLYDPKTIKLPDNPYPPEDMPPMAMTDFGELRAYSNMPAKGPIPNDLARQLIHGYYAAVSYTDAQVGRVIDELDRLGLRENTIVVLWGDHGWKLGEHGGWCKHTNFELDTHVVLLMDAPGAKANGKTVNGLVEFVDIYPTLCDLAGLPKPEHLQGTSFAPLLSNPDLPWKKAAFSQYPRGGNLMGYSMRTDGYRLTRWVDRKNPGHVVALELYDHQKDDAENFNVANKPENAALVRQLMDQSRAGWQAVRAAVGN